jgi:hypothetical protein
MACVRGSGDHVWAEFRKFRPTQRAPTPGVYSRSRSPKRTSTPVVPLIGLHRNWQLPEDRGLWPVVNLLAERPLEFWRVVRTDVRAKKELLYVEVASKNAASTFPLKRRQVTLAVLPIWKVWFSTQEGLAPVRIEESVRYAVDGREYPLEMAVTPLLLYEASDHFQIRPGVWFPRSGKQEQFLRSPDAPPVPFDPDRMVDEMLATHKLVVNEPYVMTDRREWRVLDLKLIPPRNDLWFDAPNGVAVHTLDTNEYFVQGKTEEESRRILGVLEKAPVPSEGRPATVRGVWTIAFIVLNAIAICAFLLRRMALRRHSS